MIAAKAQAKRDRESEAADAEHREGLHGQLVEPIDANMKLAEQVHALVSTKQGGDGIASVG